MTFNEFPYVHQDIDRVSKELDNLINRINCAIKAEDAIGCLYDFNKIDKEFIGNSVIAEIRNAINTNDQFYISEIEYYAKAMPVYKKKSIDFMSQVVKSEFLPQLKECFGEIMFDSVKNREKTINEAILGDLEKESLLIMQYRKIIANASTVYDGKTIEMSDLDDHMMSSCREERHKAWKAYSDFYSSKKDDFDRIYLELRDTRIAMAKKLGLTSFTELGYLRMNRNCYTKEDVEHFRKQVKEQIVPLVNKLKKKQELDLGVDKLRYYDDNILSKEGYLRPILGPEQIYQEGIKMYKEMSPESKEFIEKMDAMKCFDLMHRKGKNNTAFCEEIANFEIPFIFANFSGSTDDVSTFTHEGGHAFSSYVCLKEAKIRAMLDTTYEYNELQAIAMEYITWPYYDRFYGDKTSRVKIKHLLGALYFIPYGCMVDEFQHIVYEDPTYTAEKLSQEWLRLESEYRPYMDYEDLKFFTSGRGWQRQSHIYTVPFYYIDYCLAYIGALQFFKILQTEGFNSAWDKYMKMIKNGYKTTFVGALHQAGLKSPFDSNSVKDIIDTVKDYLNDNNIL